MIYYKRQYACFNPYLIARFVTKSTPFMMILILCLLCISTKHKMEYRFIEPSSIANGLKQEPVIQKQIITDNLSVNIEQLTIINETTDTKIALQQTETITYEPMYTNSTVNVREQPTIESAIIDTVQLGTELIVSNTIDGWCCVEYDSKCAYVSADLLSEDFPATKVSSTAYYNKYGRDSASMRPLIANHSLAGKVEWLGKSANLYNCNADGTIGSFIGTYRFDDTGYGQETGDGTSKILNDKTIGTIENGTCVDIYMDTYDECRNYGRHDIYIQILP